jgi:small membrane protein
MFQQAIALIIILFFTIRLLFLKKEGGLPAGEFIFWLVFWVLAAASVLSLRWIDGLVAKFGFSASGINFLAYIAILILFYMIFRLRLKIEKMDKNITALVRKIAIDNQQDINIK